MRYMLLVSSLLMVASPGLGQGLQIVSERGSLRGMTEMSVLIEKDDLLEKLGTDYTRLQNSVELWLRQSGIKVIEQSDNQELIENPYLYVNPTCIRVGEFVACNVGVDFKRVLRFAVPVNDSLGRVGRASTWNDGTVVLRRNATSSDVIDVIHEVVDVFLNDYLAENPRR